VPLNRFKAALKDELGFFASAGGGKNGCESWNI
jgi:hypothetical protein